MSIHIGAQPGEIAETVLLPGDPLRARYIAETYLSDLHQYSNVRGMLGYTGIYQNKRISVQGGGMGLPSTAIYVHELLHTYDVKAIIRLGTTGSIQPKVEIGDIVLAMSACTDSNINRLKFESMDYAPTADFDLLSRAYQAAKQQPLPVHVGPVFSTDTFYNGDINRYAIWRQHGVLTLEMESAVLYTLAAALQAKALSILSVSDHLITGEVTSARHREKQTLEMAEIALRII